MSQNRILSHAELLELKRWNTPTIYNGWEQITKLDHCADAFNLEETRDFMPQMGPMVGYAVTLRVEPSNPLHRRTKPTATSDYRRYLASVPGPKIVVVQDLDKPRLIGSFWGEVNANIHRALGCVGTITDGAIRDLDEMTNAGFKSIARRLCVGHAPCSPSNSDARSRSSAVPFVPGISSTPTNTDSSLSNPTPNPGFSKPHDSWIPTNARRSFRPLAILPD